MNASGVEDYKEYFEWIYKLPLKDDFTGYHPLEIGGK